MTSEILNLISAISTLSEVESQINTEISLDSKIITMLNTNSALNPSMALSSLIELEDV